jgi:phosphate transport system permease protein
MKSGIGFRVAKDVIFRGMIILFSILSGIPLIVILYFIVKNGISSINWEFIVNLPKPVGEIGGGVSNAIIGTFILIIISSIISVPIGLSAGIYLSENRRGKIPYIVRLCVETLQGIPSIVIGIIAYAWIVVPMKSPSALSGGVALGIMMLPVIIRTTEETLKLIPISLREASLALGVPYFRTILRVVLPAGLSGIVTGILLSIARITGETAPLLFTAFGSNFMNLNVFKPIASLPLVIFNYATSPYNEWISLAWGASFVLVVLALGLNLIAKLVARKWKVQF